MESLGIFSWCWDSTLCWALEPDLWYWSDGNSSTPQLGQVHKECQWGGGWHQTNNTVWSMGQGEPSKADLMSLGLKQASQHVPSKMCQITRIETPTLFYANGAVRIQWYRFNKDRKASKTRWRNVTQCNTHHCLASPHYSLFLLCQESPNFVMVSTYLLCDLWINFIVLSQP